MEAIIHCNNRFDRAAEKLFWDSEDRFDNYDEIFEDKALNYWINDVKPSYPIGSIESKKPFEKPWELW